MIICAEHLSKTYDDEGTVTQALHDVSFAVNKGEFVSIMGPSGSGKSTLLHILSFLDRPTGGEYKFLGYHINDLDDAQLAHTRNSEMGFIFQSFNLLGHSTVYENVEMPLLYSENVSSAKRLQMTHDAVRAVGLEEKTDVETGRLSGGQKQRVAIARALVNNPSVIFADEPTGNLDSESGAQVMQILKKLHGEGHTIILVTHETYTAEFADRLIRIRDGRVESDQPISKSNHRFFK